MLCCIIKGVMGESSGEGCCGGEGEGVLGCSGRLVKVGCKCSGYNLAYRCGGYVRLFLRWWGNECRGCTLTFVCYGESCLCV